MDAVRKMSREIASGCLMARARKVSRLVTLIYDDALRPHGLNASRMNLLVAVGLSPGITSHKLGEYLEIEKSTMSRNMGQLEDAGLIVQEKVGRQRRLYLTPDGEARIAEAKPSWEQAQEAARETLGSLADAMLERYPMPGDP
ncbi:MAG: MarR family winged helix-turn-helix transcriptional regulator [bacterium]